VITSLSFVMNPEIQLTPYIFAKSAILWIATSLIAETLSFRKLRIKGSKCFENKS
jgi:hypothetical protein